MLDMFGADLGFNDTKAVLFRIGGEVKKGKFVKTEQIVNDDLNIVLQGAKASEIKFITGGERISDIKSVHINDGTMLEPELGDHLRIDGKVYKVVHSDNRPNRNYCRALIERIDPGKVDA